MKADCFFPLRGCFIYICYPPPALSECPCPPPPSISHCCASPHHRVCWDVLTPALDIQDQQSAAFMRLFILKLQHHLGNTKDICHALNHWQVDLELFAGPLSEQLKEPNDPPCRLNPVELLMCVSRESYQVLALIPDSPAVQARRSSASLSDKKTQLSTKKVTCRRKAGLQKAPLPFLDFC